MAVKAASLFLAVSSTNVTYCDNGSTSDGDVVIEENSLIDLGRDAEKMEGNEVGIGYAGVLWLGNTALERESSMIRRCSRHTSSREDVGVQLFRRRIRMHANRPFQIPGVHHGEHREHNSPETLVDSDKLSK